jgi:hypothetical protein
MFGQRKAPEVEAEIKALAKSAGTNTYLRWLTTDGVGWKLSIYEGYQIERYTLMQNGNMVEKPSVTKKSFPAIYPLPEYQWEAIVDTSNLGAIAAQAMYGESFEVEGATSSSLAVFNMARELENRFSFAAYAADQNFQLAQWMGLAFVDTEVKEGDRYVYKIYSLVKKEKHFIDTAYIFVNTDEEYELPKPIDLEAKFDNKSIIVQWPTHYYDSYYTNYEIERSDDNGQSFISLKDNLLSNAEDNQHQQFSVFIDSVPEFNKEFMYRIRGKSPFGDLGPYSDTVAISSYKQFERVPEITMVKETTDGHIKIEWNFPEKYNPDNLGFKIFRARSINDSYSEISTEQISPVSRSYEIPTPKGVSYLVVQAEDMGGQTYTSMPALFQIADSIPPAAPSGLKGIINKEGKVDLSWKTNTDEELSGYNLYYSNSKHGEFFKLNNKVIPSNSYTYDVPVNILTKNIYYKVQAIDLYLNESEQSELIKVERPDLIPPSPPVITGYELNESWIKLEWEPSTSSDLAGHIILRKDTEHTKFDTLANYGKEFTDKHFYDNAIQPAEEYTYRILAYDENNNQSASHKDLSVKSPGSKASSFHLEVYAKHDEKCLELNWNYGKSQPSWIYIYKKIGDAPYRMIKSMEGDINKFQDTQVNIGNTYIYMIKYVIDHKKKSSNTVELKY